MNLIPERFSAEFFTVIRFALVGTVATLVHLVVSYLLIESKTTVMTANVIAFGVAFVFSFSGHYWITFRRSRHPLRSAKRFLVVSVAAFGLNNGCLALLLSLLPWPPMVLIVLALALVPVLTFLASRFWAFSPDD